MHPSARTPHSIDRPGRCPEAPSATSRAGPSQSERRSAHTLGAHDVGAECHQQEHAYHNQRPCPPRHGLSRCTGLCTFAHRNAAPPEPRNGLLSQRTSARLNRRHQHENRWPVCRPLFDGSRSIPDVRAINGATGPIRISRRLCQEAPNQYALIRGISSSALMPLPLAKCLADCVHHCCAGIGQPVPVEMVEVSADFRHIGRTRVNIGRFPAHRP